MDHIKTWLRNYRWPFLPLDAYMVGGLLYFGLRLVIGYQWWPIAFISEGLHLILPFSVALLVIALLTREWVRSAGVGVLVVLFGVLYGPQMVRGVVGVERECAECVRVMSYNIGNGIIAGEELTAYLNASDADIIGLQEVSEEDAAVLEQVEAYPYKAIYPYELGLGRAVLSRYPITYEDFRLVFGEDNAKYLITMLDVEGEEVTVIVSRFKTPRYGGYPGQRGLKTWLNANTLATEYQARQTTTVLMLDMNASVHSENMQILRRAGYVDVYQRGGGGYGLTFPARTDAWRDLPEWIPAVVRIDHILTTPDVNVAGAWVDQGMGASDHYPLFANLVISR